MINMTINETQDSIIEEFSFFDDWMDKYNVLIDLGKEFNVKGVQVNHRDGCASRKTGMKLSLSSDAKTWVTVGAVDEHLDVCEIPVTTSQAGAFLPGKKAQYIKIERELSKPDNMHLQEVKVFGE